MLALKALLVYFFIIRYCFALNTSRINISAVNTFAIRRCNFIISTFHTFLTYKSVACRAVLRTSAVIVNNKSLSALITVRLSINDRT